jgi:hypothetical protein
MVAIGIKSVHHCCVNGWGVTWSEWHDTKRILFVVWSKKCELLLILRSDMDLMVSCFVVQSNKVEATCRVAEVVDGIIAMGDRVFEAENHKLIGDITVPDSLVNTNIHPAVGGGGATAS